MDEQRRKLLQGGAAVGAATALSGAASTAHAQAPGEVLFAVDDLHPAATEDVRRPDENGVADPGGDLSDLVEAVPGSRVRLPDSKALHERRELSTVLGEVDRGRWRAEDPSPRTTAGQRASRASIARCRVSR